MDPETKFGPWSVKELADVGAQIYPLNLPKRADWIRSALELAFIAGRLCQGAAEAKDAKAYAEYSASGVPK